MVDHAPDSTLVLGRILDDRHSARSRAVLNEIPNSRIRILYEVYQEVQSVIEKKAEFALAYTQNAYLEVAKSKGIDPANLGWDDMPEILSKARTLAHGRNEGFFDGMDAFIDFVRQNMAYRPYDSLRLAYLNIVMTNKEKIRTTFGAQKIEQILVSETTVEEDEVRNNVESLIRTNIPSLEGKKRERDLRIICQLFACSKRAHESTFNFIIIEKQMKSEMPSVLPLVTEKLGDRIGQVTVQNA
ncbi:MAG TPA: hypothetical protein PLR51_00445 [Methanomassiliicoccales archaeon]|jgi:hypothetical protein|nr:hypothetical protein [Methanomassiliicoccales archaeon]HQQ24729.1 hypothetical protein [Methanomassiliicoccales archaeon]